MSKEHKQLTASLTRLLAKLDSEPMPTGEPAESVWLGRQQVADELREMLGVKYPDLIYRRSQEQSECPG